MPTITPNPKSQAQFAWASFAAYLEVEIKGTESERREIDGHAGQGRVVKFFQGRGTQGTLSIRKINGDTYKATIQRPAGRGGIAIGTKNVERVYLFTSPEDVYAYVDQFDHKAPATLEVEQA